MKNQGERCGLTEDFNRFLEIPAAFFDPRSLHVVSLLKDAEMLPEDICSKTLFDEKTVVGILLNLHVHGVLKRKQKGFKGYYSLSKENIKKYCDGLKVLSEKWCSILQESGSQK